MADIKVTPTRMELKKLKAKLATARRGHKLLKDKRDELMRRFLDIIREAKSLREELSDAMGKMDGKFAEAAALSDPKMLTEALILPGAQGELTVSSKNLMSVNVPVFNYKPAAHKENGGVPYGFAFTSGALDNAVTEAMALSEKLVKLAELEKSALLLCREIERTRRRVNALEHIMIPRYEDGVRQIVMKLDENERGAQTRLMKVKDMMIKAQLQAKKGLDEEEA
ncbi:MAG: V-type ATP synthase subunit D [Clostridia bacterium]|nr:V-type ATP synthase subunit D [Clostridia bacterium]